MKPADLSLRILRDIRDEIHGLREEQREFREEQRAFREESFARFEAIETTLRDLAEQLIMLARGVKVAISQRTKTDDRLRKLERRVTALEKRRSA